MLSFNRIPSLIILKAAQRLHPSRNFLSISVTIVYRVKFSSNFHLVTFENRTFNLSCGNVKKFWLQIQWYRRMSAITISIKSNAWLNRAQNKRERITHRVHYVHEFIKNMLRTAEKKNKSYHHCCNVMENVWKATNDFFLCSSRLLPRESRFSHLRVCCSVFQSLALRINESIRFPREQVISQKAECLSSSLSLLQPVCCVWMKLQFNTRLSKKRLVAFIFCNRADMLL